MAIAGSWANPSPRSLPKMWSKKPRKGSSIKEVVLRQFRGSVLTRAAPVAFFSTAISLLCILLRRGLLGDNALWMAASINHPLGVQVFGIMFAFLITNRVGRAIERRWDGMQVVSSMYLKWYDAYAFIMSYVKKDIQILKLRKQGPDIPNEKKVMLLERLGQLEIFREKLTHWFSMMNALALGTVKYGEDQASAQVYVSDKCISFDPKKLASKSGGKSKMQVLRTSFTGGLEEADRLEYLGQSTAAEETQLDAVEDKPLHVMQWICDALVLADEECLLSIPSPLMAQLFMELQDGVQHYQSAYRLAAVPYPFPMSQMISFMMKVFVCVTPIVIENFTQGWVLTPILSFLTTLSYWGLNEVAVELENPFGEDANDLPLHELCATLNERILELGTSHVQDELETVHNFSGMFERGQLSHGPIGWESLLPKAAEIFLPPTKESEWSDPKSSFERIDKIISDDSQEDTLGDFPKKPKSTEFDKQKSTPKNQRLGEGQFKSNPSEGSRAETGQPQGRRQPDAEQQAPSYKLKPYVKKSMNKDKSPRSGPSAGKTDLHLEDTDSSSAEVDLQEADKPVAPAVQDPTKRPVHSAGSTRNQAGTGECSTPGAFAATSASESSHSYNQSVASAAQNNEGGAPILALAQNSHRTEALLQQYASENPRSPGQQSTNQHPGECSPASPPGHVPAGSDELTVGETQQLVSQLQHSTPAYQTSGGSDEYVYASVVPSPGGGAAGAEYRRVAVDEIPAVPASSYITTSSGPSHQTRTRPYVVTQGGVAYTIAQTGGHEMTSSGRAVASNAQPSTNDESAHFEQQQSVPQQSPRYMYIMLPRVQQRNYAAGGYTHVQNASIVPQHMVQPGHPHGHPQAQRDYPDHYHSDELC